MDYLIKVVIFGVYMSAVYWTISFMITFIKGYLVNIPFTPLLCQFGVLTGLNIYLSIVISGYLFNRTLSFWK
jgi:hypothetical protein